MEPLSLVETTPGVYSLMLDTGTNPIDDVIEEIGHVPNGYFWDGVAQLVADPDAGDFELESEAGMFCANGRDRAALADLGTRMAAVATDPEKMRKLVAEAVAAGFEFND